MQAKTLTPIRPRPFVPLVNAQVRKMQGALTALKVAEAEAALGPSPLSQARTPQALTKKEFKVTGGAAMTSSRGSVSSGRAMSPGAGLDDALNMASNPLARAATSTTPSSAARAAHAGLAGFNARPQAAVRRVATTRGATRSSDLDEFDGENPLQISADVSPSRRSTFAPRSAAHGLDAALESGVSPLHQADD